MKYFKYFLIGFIISATFFFVDTYVVKAETFGQQDRFTVFFYSNSEEPFYTAVGNVTNTFGEVSRIQFLYSTYTFVPDYYYDISFTYKITTKDNYFYDNVGSCSIGVSGNLPTCYLNKTNGAVSATVTNLTVSSEQNSLWINFYADYVFSPTSFDLTDYTLTINAKEDTSVSSSDILDSTNKIISTDIDNKNQIIDNANQNAANIIDANNKNTEQIVDNITSEEGPDLGGLSDSAGWLPAGPVDSILTLPLNLLNNITSNLSNSCSPISLPLPFVNKNLILPCINTIYSQIDGLSAFINSIAFIISGLILYSYFLKLYKWVDHLTSMKETNTVDDWGGL